MRCDVTLVRTCVQLQFNSILFYSTQLKSSRVKSSQVSFTRVDMDMNMNTAQFPCSNPSHLIVAQRLLLFLRYVLCCVVLSIVCIYVCVNLYTSPFPSFFSRPLFRTTMHCVHCAFDFILCVYIRQEQ